MTQANAPYTKLVLGKDWWFEHLYEDETDLIRRADWAGLVRSRAASLARDPDDPERRLLLAVAYARAGRHDDALAILARLHRSRPGDELVQDYALDTLFASGRSEHDFPWIDPPLVARLETPYLDRLHELLTVESEPWALFDLMLSTQACAYLTFGEEELLAALASDDRFEIRHDGGGTHGIVRVSAPPAPFSPELGVETPSMDASHA